MKIDTRRNFDCPMTEERCTKGGCKLHKCMIEADEYFEQLPELEDAAHASASPATRDEFQGWLINTHPKRYTYNTAYAYALAIPKLSLHYSQKMNKNINIYDMRDVKILEGIVNKYSTSGIYRNEGEKGNGTHRNAIARFKEYIEFLKNRRSTPGTGESGHVKSQREIGGARQGY